MYRVTFDVIVHDPEYARRIEDYLRRAGFHIDRYNMEFINDGIQHVHTMDGQTMAVRGVPEEPPRSVRRDYEEMLAKYRDEIQNDSILRDLLEEEEKSEDFLDEKDMEL